MIGYPDTSAIVPLHVAEPGSAACRRFFDDAYVEAAAAHAQAERTGRLDGRQHEAARDLLESVWSELDIVEVDHGLMVLAAWQTSGIAVYDVNGSAAGSG